MHNVDTVLHQTPLLVCQDISTLTELDDNLM